MTEPRHEPPNAAANVEAIYPLTALQHGMLLHALEDPSARVYVEQLAVTIDGTLDADCLERAWSETVKRHAALRTSFVWKRGNRPMQVVHKEVAVTLHRASWSGSEGDATHAGDAGGAGDAVDSGVVALLERERAAGVDLGRAPLFRLLLASSTDAGRHVLVWTHHHALLDGWSVATVLTEVLALYEAFATGAAQPRLSPVRPFKDYVAWLGRNASAGAGEFWRAYLSGAHSAPSLLAVLAPPEGGSSTLPTKLPPTPPAKLPTQRSVALSRETTAALAAVARRDQVTLATVVQVAWAILLARLAGTNDVVFGVTMSGRPSDLEGADAMVGLFINTVPLRVRVDPDENLGATLQRVHREIAAVRPFEWTSLVETLAAAELPRGTPLFEGIVVVENFPASGLAQRAPRGLAIRAVRVVEETNYPWMLVVGPGQELTLRLDADPARMDALGADATLAHLSALLDAMAGTSPQTAISSLSMIPRADRARLDEWNATNEPWRDGQTIVDLFLRGASEHPSRVAVEATDGNRTYEELAARARALANLLRGAGVARGARVGVALARTTALVEALLAIGLCGAAYVPLDPAQPAARSAGMAKDARVALVVTERALEAALQPLVSEHGGLRLVVIDDVANTRALAPLSPAPMLAPPAAAVAPRSVAPLSPAPDDLAYVLFTSGSTGRPKGVAVCHRSVGNVVLSLGRAIGLSRDDRWLAVTPLTFDIAGLEIFAPLAFGATVVLAREEESADGALLCKRIAETRPSVLQATPSTFRMCTAIGALDLSATRVLVGGEALNRELARELLGSARSLWNVYGPTETTIWSTLLHVDDAEASGAGYVAIGRPIANTQAHVLDTHGARVGVGVIGDLVLAGAGLAEGYVADDERTRASFRMSEACGGRVYATGDRARFRRDGVLVFEGRSDGQIKLRGHRIELGEIEAQLEAHPGVAQAAAVLTADGEHLVAYVVPKPSDRDVEPSELRAWLGERLPSVYVPTWIVARASLPRTPNGKVDRRALASLDVAPTAPPHTGRSEPTAVEAIVLAIIEEVLKRSPVGLDDDFFDLGGHSLLATQLTARVRRALGVELPLRSLFEGGTARAIAAAVAASRGHHVARPPLLEREPAAPVAPELSFAQARLWFIDQLEPQRAFYNVPALVRLRGRLDTAALEASFTSLALRHATLRTTFPSEAGVPSLRISAPAPVPLRIVDLGDLLGDARDAEVRRLARAEVQRPFDLEVDLLFRVLLLRLDANDHVVVLTMHHIASDGWSIGVLIDELVALYGARGDASVLPALATDYATFATWQRRWLGATGVVDAEIDFWKRELAGVAPLGLPTDRLRPAVQGFRGRRHAFTIDAELATELRVVSRRSSATLFMTLLAVWSTLLSRLVRHDDIAVGTPVANRVEPELERLIGFFANTLVLRIDTSGDPKLGELVARVRDKALAAYTHQDVPFEQVVDALAKVRDRSRAPLFQTMFVLQNAPRASFAADGLSFDPIDADLETSKVDLELTMMERDGGALLGSIEYDVDLFAEATVAAWSDAFVDLLRAAAATPDERLSRLCARPAKDVARLLGPWAGPTVRYPTDESVASAIERRVAASADSVAVIDDTSAYSYGDLDAAANRVAHALIARGVRPGDRVGIAVQRSKDLIAAILGALKAGAAYVPLEPDVPIARRIAMAEDAGTSVVVSEDEELAAWGARALALRTCVVDGDASKPDVSVRGSDLAYVLYTSGSTGKPKGVMVEHRSIVNRIEWQQETLRLTSDEAVLHKTPYGFDVSVWELFWALRQGARLVVAKPDGHKDAAYLVDVVRKHSISTVHFVPSMLAAFLEAEGLSSLTSLKRVLASGEALSVAHVERFRARLPWATLHNLYGPTEAAVDVTHWQVPAPPAAVASVPIGRPVANTRAYVVGRHGEVLPPGALGELWVAGIQVARGYAGDPTRTEERFVPDPLVATDRAYRTGDLARFAPDGTLEFLGRIDEQIKLRGHRIELGEIESALRSHEAVTDAAVALRGAPGGEDARLVAFVVARDDEGRAGRVDDAHVAEWRDVFDATYGDDDDGDATTDLRGWTSSFDGQAIPEPEMGAWIDATVSRILERRPRRVLEIGCGTGLLLFRIAPEVQHYVGVDVAPRTLARVARHAAARGLSNIALHALAADEVARLAGETFDAIVINSVVQYFPDAAYLRALLETCGSLLASDGFVFLGDVRSLPLARGLAFAIELAHAPGSATAPAVARATGERLRGEEELLVDPRFFFRVCDPAAPDALSFAARVDDVSATPKRGRFVNELSAYRYDVTLSLRSTPHHDRESAAPVMRTFDEVGASTAGIASAVAAAGERGIVISGIPNGRVVADLRVAALAEAGKGTASELRARRDLMVDAMDPEELFSVAARAGRPMRVGWDLERASEGALSVVAPPLQGAAARTQVTAPADELVSRPREAILRRTLPARLRSSLRVTLPDVMVPAHFVFLDDLPRGATGKIDRRALPIDDGAAKARRAHVAPRTELEAAVAAAFSAVLGVERISVADHFFELGGHSLLATRLVSRLSTATGHAVPLRRVFEHPTVEALAAAIGAADQGAALSPETEIEHREAPVAPLTFAQRRLFFLEELAPGTAAWVVPAAIRIEGAIDVDGLRRALAAVLRRHRVLRARIEAPQDGEPIQRATSMADVTLPVLDLSGLPYAARNEALHDASVADASRPFNLATGPLFRAQLIVLAEDDHVLLVAGHHLAVDRASLDVIVTEVSAYYTHRALPPLAIDYFDFARWQRAPEQSASIDEGIARVRARLSGAPPLIGLPLDRPRRVPRSLAGARARFSVSATVGAAVESLARKAATTPFAVFTAALASVLARYGAGDDIVLGTAVAGRPRADVERLVGMFVNTVPLRLRVPLSISFSNLVASARSEILESLSHAHVPFEALLAATSSRSLAFEPIVQAMLVLQNGSSAPLVLGDARLSLLDADSGTSKLDFTMFLEALPSGEWAGAIEYRTDVFDHDTIVRLASAFVTLLARALEQPNEPLARTPIVDDAEHARLVALGKGAITPRAAVRVDEAIRRAAHPVHAALMDRARALAPCLEARGAKRGARVAVAVEGADAIVTILATLATGAAWVPVPPSTPVERARAIFADASPAVVVTRGAVVHALPRGAAHVDLDASIDGGQVGPAAILAPPTTILAPPASTPKASTHEASSADDDAAYVLYTSGSTGEPKGVVVSHRALANHMAWMQGTFAIDASDVVLVRTPLGFDASVWELLWPLLSGARIAIAPPGEHADPVALEETVRRLGVTVLQLVPTLLDAFVTSGGLARCPSVRFLFAGGEALTAHLRDHVHEATKALLVNLYGPTETTIDATFHVCARVADAVVPIGKAIDNVRSYVVDEALALVPRGAVGELCVAGAGVAEGYLGREALTRERFLADPFVVGERIYRTGDRARMREDGALEFLGRFDSQVKLGGARIELGEIEAALRVLQGVREAAAVLSRDGLARVLGFVVGNGPFDAAAARSTLLQRLPPSAVPSELVMLTALPLLPSGKLDRAALLAHVEEAPSAKRSARPPPEPAATEVEETLARVFRDVLRVPDVSATDDFFALGGDSILSLQIVARARAAGIVLRTRDVFEARTVRALALCAKPSLGTRASHAALDPSRLPLMPAQALFFELDLAEPHHFAQAAVVVVPAAFDVRALERALAAVIGNHEALRLAFDRPTTGAASQRILAASSSSALAADAITKVDLTATPDADLAATVERISEAVARSLDPSRGKVVALAWLDCGRARPGRVVVMAHHLVVDTVSWTVLEEDLVAAYAQSGDGNPISLAAPSASLLDWLGWLEARRSELRAKPTRVAERAGGTPLPRLPSADTTTILLESTARAVEASLSPAETAVVLRELRSRLDATLDAVLLGPLVLALAEWTGERAFAIAIESHGRDAAPEIDLSRVIGWFTAVEPIHLSLSPETRTVRDAVRDVARTVTAECSLTWGLLASSERARLPEIGWNYLGRVGTSAGVGNAFAPAVETLGALRSPRARRIFELEIVSRVEGGTLAFSFVYSDGVHSRAAIERLAATTLSGLRELAAHGRAEAAEPDATESGLDERELARVLKRLGKKRG